MLKNRRFIIVPTLALIAFAAIAISSRHSKGEEHPLNIILFIGDGMGIPHVSGAMAVKGGTLNLEKFSFTGLVKTESSDAYITDSGAAGTAIATGVKTRNGMIGMGPDSIASESILDLATKAGMSTAIITTSAITHSTPAAFSSHNISRRDYEGIARDISVSGIDLLIGGGLNNFVLRKDSVNLLRNMKESGYTIINHISELEGTGADKAIFLTAPGHMDKAMEGRSGYLAEAVAYSIKKLSGNKKGFFLMVEGSMIDWGAHANDQDYTFAEILDFDEAVGIAYNNSFLKGNTLIIVTADHETGGLAIMMEEGSETNVIGVFATDDHSGEMVPLFADGPGAANFSGVYENTAIFHKLKEILSKR